MAQEAIFNHSRALYWKVFRLTTNAYVEPTVLPTLRNEHVRFEVYNVGKVIWSITTRDVAGDPGANGPSIDASAIGEDNAFFVASGIGRHRDITVVAHFAGGEQDWKYREHLGVRLSDYGCGKKGLKTFIGIGRDEVEVAFGVGSGVTGMGTGCHGIFSIDKGLQFTQT